MRNSIAQVILETLSSKADRYRYLLDICSDRLAHMHASNANKILGITEPLEERDQMFVEYTRLGFEITRLVSDYYEYGPDIGLIEILEERGGCRDG